MSKGLLVAIESDSAVIIGEGEYNDIFKLEDTYSRLLTHSGVKLRVIGEESIHLQGTESVSKQLLDIINKLESIEKKEEVAGGKGTPTI